MALAGFCEHDNELLCMLGMFMVSSSSSYVAPNVVSRKAMPTDAYRLGVGTKLLCGKPEASRIDCWILRPICHLLIRVALRTQHIPTVQHVSCFLSASAWISRQCFFVCVGVTACPTAFVYFFHNGVRNTAGCDRIRTTCAEDSFRACIFIRTWIASWWRWSEQIFFTFL